MCEKITYVRFILFTLIFIMLITSISYSFIFCRRKKIDMNTFSGIFEMYRHVFSFKDKIFSITILVCIYGGALLVFFTAGISLWAEGHGCIFPTKYS